MKFSRRRFIQTTALTGAFMPFAGAMASEIQTGKQNQSKIYYFSKDLDKYETEFMTETLSLSGVDGLDLTVRPGGKVEPEKVTDDLPKVVETGNKYNLATNLIVTAITGTEDPLTEKVLITASALGVKHYRLGYYDYDLSEGVLKSLENIKSRLRSLSDMNRHFNIQAGYQNHSGGRVGSPGWDVWELVKDFPVETISSQFDVRHAKVEGNRSWIFVLHLLSKNIGSLAIKDFTWHVEKGRARIVNVPLGEGLVDFNLYFQTLKELKINAPITLHVEYPLLTAKEESFTLLAKQKIIVDKIRKDVQFIRNMTA
ncbi:MAG: sugar phosphate isomerase/epimerase family protein [Bacteroidales bacterium]